MKRTITLIISLLCWLMATQSFAQSARLLMIEEATQASCGPCATQNPAFDALLDANSDKVIVLKYQTAFPGFDPMYLDNPDEMQARTAYYSVDGVPTAFMNGSQIPNCTDGYQGAPACLSQARIDAAYNNAAAFDLEVEATFDDGVLNVSGSLTANADVSGDLKLRLALAEKTINNSDAPGGTNGETKYHHVLKKFITGAEGTDLENTWAAGDKYDISESINAVSINVYRYTEFELIAFVQDDATKNILQAAKDEDIPLNINHANNAVMAVIAGIQETVCGSGETITPTITIQNLGSENLTSADITYGTADGTQETYQWTGSLATYEKDDIDLSYTFDTNDESTFSANIQNPNGAADDNSIDNSLQVTVSEAPSVSQNAVTLELTTDAYGAETYWEITTSAGNLLYNGGNSGIFDNTVAEGAYENNTTYTQELLLPADDCYDFTIYDAFGDGICCTLGEGSYKLTDASGTVLAQGGEFRDQEIKPATLAGGMTVANNARVIGYSGLSDPFCGDLTYAPTLKVRNTGAEDITSLNVEIKNEGNTILNYDWTGNITALGGEADVELGEITVTDGADLKFNIMTVNGATDALEIDNTYDIALPAPIQGYDELTLTINTDCYPAESTWEMLDENGSVVASGGPYADAGTEYIETININIGACYDFIFKDQYNDGMFGSYWEEQFGCTTDGNYTLTDGLDNILVTYDGTYFFSEESTFFQYSMSVGVEETIFETGFTASPNPTSGMVMLDFGIESAANTTVSVHDMLGKQVMELDMGTLASGNHLQEIDMSYLTNGVYVIRLNAEGDYISKKIVLTK